MDEQIRHADAFDNKKCASCGTATIQLHTSSSLWTIAGTVNVLSGKYLRGSHVSAADEPEQKPEAMKQQCYYP